jgi:hypothetical protein
MNVAQRPLTRKNAVETVGHISTENAINKTLAMYMTKGILTMVWIVYLFLNKEVRVVLHGLRTVLMRGVWMKMWQVVFLPPRIIMQTVVLENLNNV